MAAARGPLARALLLVAVFLTGATGLAYEVAWSRGLVLVLGATATTTAVVLGVFVGGLGLGARWGGGRADGARRPLLLYGLLELGAALWALLALPLAGWLEVPWVAAARPAPDGLRLVLRVGVAAAVVLPGAILLGATLPALVRHRVRQAGDAGRWTAWLYGTNTTGAVLGALVAGFFGIEALGVTGLLLAAAAVGGGVGLLAALAGRDAPAEDLVVVTPPDEGPAAGLHPGGAVIAAGLCGLLGIGAEIAGFRLLVFFLEGFTATFAAMLGVFVAGLGAGSLLLAPRLVRRPRPDRALALLLALFGATLLLESLFLLPHLEPFMRDVRAWAYRGGGADPIPAGLRRSALAGAAAVLLLPAFLLGPGFALAVRWAERGGLAPGRAVGRVYLANSVGSLLAPLVIGFVLVPAGGVLLGWYVVAALGLLGGGLLAVHARLARGGAWRPALAVVALALLVLLTAAVAPSDGDRRLVGASHVLRDRPDRSLLAVDTDEITTASVIETGEGERILYTDDFAAAATGRHYRYMRMLGHLPVLLCERPEHAMVIAFGTGTTAGAVASHPDVRRLEVVEVSRAVLGLAPFFEAENRHVLEDERVTVHRDDGRGALLLHAADLDVITLEPLMPYSPQGLPFYTREFYELARSRLRDGGVLCQWLPVHAMPAGLWDAFLRTFLDVFPDGTVWFFEQSAAFVGRRGGHVPEEADLARRIQDVAEDLEAVGLASLDRLASAYVASGAAIRAAPPPPSPWRGRLVEDLDPFPELHPSPRAPLSTTWLRDTMEYLAVLVAPGDLPFPWIAPGSGKALRLREATRWGLLARRQEAEAALLETRAQAMSPGSAEQAQALAGAFETWQTAAAGYREALERLPGEGVLAVRATRAARAATRLEVLGHLRRAEHAEAAGRAGEAADLRRLAERRARDAAALDDAGDPVAAGRGEAALLHAATLLRLGRCLGAREAVAEALVALPPGAAQEPLAAAEAWIVDREGGADGPPPPGLAAWLPAGLPACRREGLGDLAADLARLLDRARRGGDVRALRLEADNLREAAREQDRVAALLEAAVVTDDLPPVGGAVLAGLRRDLDPEDRMLEGFLGAGDAARIAAGIGEAARRHQLGRDASRVARLARHEDPGVRSALADGIGEDGARALLPLAADLLADPDRGVRQAAAAALARHAPAALGDYDYDAPPALREAAAARARAALR